MVVVFMTINCIKLLRKENRYYVNDNYNCFIHSFYINADEPDKENLQIKVFTKSEIFTHVFFQYLKLFQLAGPQDATDDFLLHKKHTVRIIPFQNRPVKTKRLKIYIKWIFVSKKQIYNEITAYFKDVIEVRDLLCSFRRFYSDILNPLEYILSFTNSHFKENINNFFPPVKIFRLYNYKKLLVFKTTTCQKFLVFWEFNFNNRSMFRTLPKLLKHSMFISESKRLYYTYNTHTIKNLNHIDRVFYVLFFDDVGPIRIARFDLLVSV